MALAHRTFSEILLGLEPSNPQKAEHPILEAIRILQEIDARPELARSYMICAQILVDSEEKAKANEYIEKAVGMFQQMDMTWDLAQAEHITSKLKDSA